MEIELDDNVIEKLEKIAIDEDKSVEELVKLIVEDFFVDCCGGCK